MKNTITIFSMFLLLLMAACGGCDDQIPERDLDKVDMGDLGESEACALQCMEGEMAFFGKECKIECEKKHSRFKTSPENCIRGCDKFVKQKQGFAERKCNTQCFNNDDHDGIPNGLDQCPDTPKGYPVNWLGCRDSDQDGVPDVDDKCKNSLENMKVNTRGCAIEEISFEKNSVHEIPGCKTAKDCAKEKEIPLITKVPEQIRKDWIRFKLSQKIHPQKCPGVRELPGQPYLISPQGITKMPIEKYEIEFKKGKIVKPITERLHFEWTKVNGKCNPVTYAVFVETYHCHRVRGINDARIYLDRGWCKWEPLEYKSGISDTKFDYKIELSKVLFQIHEAFENEQHWNPPKDGKFVAHYAPFWVRTRVLTIDGNGNASPSGMHSNHQYYVFHHPDRTTTEELINIPIAP